MSADIVLAQRQYSRNVADNMLYEAMKHGIKVIYELDDFLSGVIPSSPVFGIYHQGSPEIKMVGEIMSKCTGVTVSTRELAGECFRYNNAVEIIPNSIDYEIRDWKTKPEDKDPNYLVVGWSGGSTHWEDLQLIKDIVIKMLDKYPYVKFGIYTSEQLMKVVVEDWELDPERVLFIPPRSFHEYPGGLGYFDISLVPTINCRFNASKSNLILGH